MTMTVQSRAAPRRLSIRYKLILPFVAIIALMLLVVFPIASLILAQRIEQEADRRLSQVATSVTHLLEQRQDEAALAASFVANLAETEALHDDRGAAQVLLQPRRDQLGLNELSLYAEEFKAGDPAFYYGGPPVTRRLQVSERTRETRDGLILTAIALKEVQSAIVIAPQSSQILSAAPILHDGEVHGVILAAFFLDNNYAIQVDQILDIDMAVIRDNAVIVSTIDPASGYEQLLQAGFVQRGMTTARTIRYGDGSNRRLLAYPLLINSRDQGHLLVAKTIDDLMAMQEQIQGLLLVFAGVMIVGLGFFAFSAILNFARPIVAMAHATRRVAAGDLDQRVPVPKLMFRDEIVDLSENFNTMTGRLHDFYQELEQRVTERTQDLSHAMRELALTRDKALEANRAKSVFLANMSHELRTPLNAIIGYSEMLQEEADDFGYSDIVPDLEKIRKAGKHLLAVINDILDLSKIEAGKMELYLETFQFEDLIDEIVSTIQPVVDKNQNKLIVDAKALGVVKGDMTKLRQVIFNLLSNAAKFTKAGTVVLTTERVADGGIEWIHVEVRDTGIGMTPEQVQVVFQEFTQADASTTRKYGGTGLGLAISRHFCQMMGGTIEVQSVAGVGSTFTMIVPAEVRPSPTTTSTGELQPVKVITTEQPAAGSLSGQPVVLVIDDDAEVRDLLQRTLSREGFSVHTASSGSAGLEAARQLRPRVITLDVMMPEMDGWSVLAQIKDDPQLAAIPVIMLTMVDSKSLGFALGATDYLTKPIDRNLLVTLLKQQLRPAGAGPAQVLVVEDDPEIRELIRRTLDKEGLWTIQEAENGRVGLQRLAQSTPHVILLDLMMPEMDGLQFIAELRQQPAWRSIPIIVITAKELTLDDHRQLNGHVERILQKAAYSRDDLLNEVRALVKNYTVA